MREIRTLRCDVEGTGNVAWSRYCDTRRRKSELTVNTNFDLNRRASPRPYLREAGGGIPPAYSPPSSPAIFARNDRFEQRRHRRYGQHVGVAREAIVRGLCAHEGGATHPGR